jgi:hypothetical protein
MDEHVLAAAIRRDEAEALCGIEELHGADGHWIFLSVIGLAVVRDAGPQWNKIEA